MFYHIGPDASSFIFPQVGPGNKFCNGPITSITLFAYLSIPDAGASVVLFGIALGGVLMMIIYSAPGRRASW